VKAQEWANRFDTTADLGAELKAFIDEIGTVADARGGTVNAVEGAVKEQKVKFLAVCARTEKVNPGLWPQLMKAHGTEYMADVRVYLNRKKGRQNKR
jgi:hypothetical protein